MPKPHLLFVHVRLEPDNYQLPEADIYLDCRTIGANIEGYSPQQIQETILAHSRPQMHDFTNQVWDCIHSTLSHRLGEESPYNAPIVVCVICVGNDMRKAEAVKYLLYKEFCKYYRCRVKEIA